ncbi:DCST2 protein, partial [Pterocles burchelli]|nr:DCST2 protein [Pterocles burchelli]
RSTGGLALGMALAGGYGAVALLAQGHDPWFCLVTTGALGAALGLAMAFSGTARVAVLLALPHLFTREGKVLVLVLALGVAVQGPCTNILLNFSRAAESLAPCPALQPPQPHFLPVPAARALRNVWLWLSRVGDVCNEELGSPFQRCVSLFDDAKDRCERAIPFLFFLCYVIVPFKALCGLAQLALLFCIIPNYIQSFLRRKVSKPIEDALDRVRQEFEFNISASHRFDVRLGATKSLGEVALEVMEGARRRLEPSRRLLGLCTHVTFLAILYIYLQAVRYRHRYLHDDTFDNVYITRRFVALDRRCAEGGRPTVLPLTHRERGRYIPPAALLLSHRERRRYGVQVVGVLRHVLLGLSIILTDYGLFWLLDLVRHHLRAEIVARAPVVMGVSVTGTGYTSDIFRDLVSAFDVLQRGNVTVVSPRCLPQPAEPDYGTYRTMGERDPQHPGGVGHHGGGTPQSDPCPPPGLLYGICLFIAVCGTHAARLRRGVCAAFYPQREQERVSVLHATILARRAGLARALRQAATRQVADGGHGNLVLYLSAR